MLSAFCFFLVFYDGKFQEQIFQTQAFCCKLSKPTGVYFIISLKQHISKHLSTTRKGLVFPGGYIFIIIIIVIVIVIIYYFLIGQKLTACVSSGPWEERKG